jgi:DNA (cytosine-5)-methyltransferase 1
MNFDEKMTFIDLFCGCGGFTLGLERAGLRCLAAVDFNAEAVDTLRRNRPSVKYVLERDLTQFAPDELAAMIGVTTVDVIVGGPPCQGFSTARQADGANHGERLKHDSRRHLYQELLKYVEFFKPKVFVMENVLGIKSAAGGEYFVRVQSEARVLGYVVHGQVEDARLLGLPQKRKRQLIVGTRVDLPGYFLPTLKPAPSALPDTNLGDAIEDLPPLEAGQGENECEYDLNLRSRCISSGGAKTSNYLFNVLDLDKSKKLTNHVSRPHSDRDLRDFQKLQEGESSAVAMRRNVDFEFPYKKTCFKDRYTRQSRSAPCSTIVAHLSKDGLMFIHPTQNRSLTPREAARIQSFPDWFRFPDARTHSFRMIGNAVPPLIAEAVGQEIIQYIKKKDDIGTLSDNTNESVNVPKHIEEALQWLSPLLGQNNKSLRQLAHKDFIKGWAAILFLYPGLHPDGALEENEDIDVLEDYYNLEGQPDDLLKQCYKISGWPVALIPIASEAWRKYELKEMSDEELYFAEAQMAGLKHLRQ